MGDNMVDFKRMGEDAKASTKKVEQEDVLVMFMGGSVKICPSGSFTDQKSQRDVTYTSRRIVTGKQIGRAHV